MTLSVVVRRIAVGIVLATMVAATPAQAVVRILGGGYWFADATPSDHVLPETGFTFAFTLPDILPADLDPVGLGYTTDAIGAFWFTLDGVDVATPLASVTFYEAGDGGLFNLSFDGGETLSFFGDDIGATGILVDGVYAAYLADASFADAGFGVVLVSSVPEPAAWMLLVGGFGLVGARHRHRRAIVA